MLAVSSSSKSKREAIKRENDEPKAFVDLTEEIADLKEEETRFKAKWEAENAVCTIRYSRTR